MSEQRRQILEMLASGKINAEEAERLLAALDRDRVGAPDAAPSETVGRKKARFLHIQVNEGPDEDKVGENVNIKIPIMLLRAGVKLSSVVPKSTRSKFNEKLSDKGLNIDLNNLEGKHLEELLDALTETSIDIVSDKETVRIYCA